MTVRIEYVCDIPPALSGHYEHAFQGMLAEGMGVANSLIIATNAFQIGMRQNMLKGHHWFGWHAKEGKQRWYYHHLWLDMMDHKKQGKPALLYYTD